MARRRRTSTFKDLVGLASRLPWWMALVLGLISYLLLHSYATSPLPSVADSRQIGVSLTSSMFRGLALSGQYFLPFIFACGAACSAFTQYQRRKVFNNVASASRSAKVLDGIGWYEFELLIAEVFRRKDYVVSALGGVGPDGGVDLVLHKDGESYLVQCKHWRSMKVGVGVVREFLGVMVARGAVGGFIVCSGSFTDEAKNFSLGTNVELVDGHKLRYWFDLIGEFESTKGSSFKKYGHFSSAPACPACKSDMVLRTAKRGFNVGGNFWGCSKYPFCKGIRNF